MHLISLTTMQRRRGLHVYVKLTRCALFFLGLFLLAGCQSHREAEQLLLGTWEGESLEGFSWCLSYVNGGKLQGLTRQELKLLAKDGTPVTGAEIIKIEGSWEIKTGLRLIVNSLEVQKIRVPVDMFAQRVAASKPISKQTGYLIERVGDEEMRYRSIKLVDSWYVAKRVDRCSEKFDLGI